MAADEVPIFECLVDSWVDENIGLFFLIDMVDEGGNIMWLCAALPEVVRRWTGTRS